MNTTALFIAVFLACVVEAVEATTIVVAAGATRSWRSAIVGVVAGLLVLTAAVSIAGPAISLLPIGALRLVVGALLLVFGLQWMRKAILRASGYKPLHDEALIYEKQVAAAKSAAPSQSRFGVSDWYAFTLSFKGVVLEGLEVVFIVLTFGTNQHNVPVAGLAAGIAVVLVVILGVVVKGPLSRVPENTLKFIVGIMLTSFGVFWGAEGAGALWPGSDLSLLVIIPSVAVFALVIVQVMRARRTSQAKDAAASSTHAEVLVTAGPSAGSVDEVSSGAAGAQQRSASAEGASAFTSERPSQPNRVAARLKGFGLFWYDFVIGDDWQIATGVALGLALTFALSLVTPLAWIVGPVIVALLLPWGIRRALR
ncbi:MAG TPA: hypothetical protein VGI56_01445 [Galbitalea sp.]|jgi:uncharacterized membrane protein